MYHLEGEDLVLTHYCALGNQPRMRLDTSHSTAGELRFEFTGGGNLDAKKDTHIHSGRIQLVTVDKMESEWTVFSDGKAAGSHSFPLTRKKS